MTGIEVSMIENLYSHNRDGLYSTIYIYNTNQNRYILNKKYYDLSLGLAISSSFLSSFMILSFVADSANPLTFMQTILKAFENPAVTPP